MFLGDRLSVCPVLSVTLAYCDQTVGWIKMKLDMEVGFGPRYTVLDGDPALPFQKGHSPPHFRPMSAVWIKMPLVTEVNLGPGDIMLYGNPAPPEKGAQQPAQQPPLFGPCLLWRNGWMDQDATWYGGRSRPRPHCIR